MLSVFPSRLLRCAQSSVFSREDSVETASTDPVTSVVKREKGALATLVKPKSSSKVNCKRNNWICFTIPA